MPLTLQRPEEGPAKRKAKLDRNAVVRTFCKAANAILSFEKMV